MTTITTLLTTAAALIAWEFVKQIGVRLVEGTAPPAIAQGLLVLDRLLPQLIADGVTGAELEERLRAELGELTGSEWRAIRREFDPVAFLNHQHNE